MTERSHALRRAAALLASALVLSCGGAPQPVATGGTAPPEATAASAAEGAPGATPDPVSAQTEAPRAPQPEGPARPGGVPALPQGNEVGPVRRGGAPPGVEHDIPQQNNPYSDEWRWLSEIADACTAVGEPSNCLTLHYRVFVEDPDTRDQHPVADPGSRFAEATPRLYDSCNVRSVHPPSQPATTVPAGTKITVTIVCSPSDPTTDPEVVTPPESTPASEQAPPQGPGG